MKKTMTRALVMFLFTVMLVSSLTAGLLGISAGALSFTKVDNAVIAVPETIYMTPSTGASTTGQYYVNNTVTAGSFDVTLEQNASNTKGYVQLYIPGAKSFTYTVTTVTSGIGDVVASNEGTSYNFESNDYKALNDRTISINGTGITAGNTALAEWKFTVVMDDGSTREYYAYSTLYSPYYNPVGSAAETSTGGSGSREGFLGTIFWIDGVHSAANSNYSGSTYYYANSSNMLPMVGAFYSSGFNNTQPQTSWLQTSSNGLFNSFTYVRGDNNKNHQRTNVVSPVAKINVDTSRYTNFNQIPNVKLGFMITDSENMDNGKWYIADYTGYNYENGDGDGKDLGSYTNGGSEKARREDYYNASHGTTFASGSDKDCALKFHGSINFAVSTGSIMLKAASGANETGGATKRSAWNNNFIELNVTGANKNALRQAVLQGTSVNRNNYTTATWNAYQTALRKAALALGNPSNSDVSSATALTNAKNALKLNKVIFDNLIDFTEWNTSSASNATISNVTTGGFTLTSNAGVGEGTSSSPYFPVTPGKQYRIDIDITGNNWDVYIFFCDANGTWIDFADGPSNRVSYGSTTGVPVDNAVFTAPNKSEVVKAQIRVDANGGSNAVTFSNIRVYEVGAVEDGVSFETSKAVALNNKYGTLPTPTRAGYNFLGWYKADGTKITANDVVNAAEVIYVTSRWEKAAYTVVWKNYDGTELKKVTDVVIGSTEPSYSGATPTKPADVQNTYTFSGWAKSGSPESGTVTYTAQYTATPIMYTVTFKYYSNATTTKQFTYGSAITLPNNTAVSSDSSNHYIYSWPDVTGMTVTNNTTVIEEIRTAEAHDAYWGDWVVDKAADCTNDGSKHRNCSKCGYTAAEVIEKLGHTPSAPKREQYSAGSCTVPETYYEVIYCSVCAVEISRSYVSNAAPGHSWGDYTVTDEPSCTEDGSKIRYCTVCNTPDTAVIDNLGHNFSSEWTVDVEPTCTSPGSKSHHCTRCDVTVDVTPIEMKPHTSGEVKTENVKAPTCTVNGSHDEATYCTVCGTETSRKTVTDTAPGHSWGAWTQTVAPDCTNEGEQERECSVCHEKETDTVDALGHNFSEEWTTDVEATCTKPGSKSHHCTRCDEKSDVTPIEMKPHTPGEVKTENVVLPDCTTDGSHDEVTYCTVCGTETSRDTKTDAALGHTDGEEVKENTVPPTCTTDGSYDAVTYCTVCGVKTNTTKKTIPATGHTSGEAVKENEKDPTCTADGSYDAVTYCTVCNAETSRTPVTVDATGHTNAEAVVENRKDSTCKVEGSYDEVVYCSVCHAELSRVTKTIALKEHTPAEAVTENLVDSTCAAEGSYDEVVYCSVCNAELSRTEKTIALKAHTPAEAVVENNVDPDCVNDGSYDSVVYCSKCPAELSRTKITVDALGHDFSEEWTTDAPATCEEDGSKSHHCSRCDAKSDVTVIPATGHSPAEAVKENVTNATCGADGHYEDVVYCSVCNKELSRTPVAVPSTGEHVYAKELERVDPTCTTDGRVVLACGCSDDVKITKTLPATGHDYKGVVTDPTCTDKGYTTYTCANGCGSTYVDNYVDANGHSYDKVVTKPDCENKGYTTFTCSVCGDSYVGDYVDALGHSAGEAVKENETKPTCTAMGQYDSVVYCTVCGEELSRVTVPVDKVPHKPGAEFEDNRVNATCTADGSYDIVTECTVCGTETSRETKVIGKLGHHPGTPKTENNVPATCTTDGSYDTVTYCTRCQTETSRKTTTVDALGHKAGEAVIENNVAPKCEEDGSYDTVVYCTVCGAEISRETTTVDALGHKAGEAVIENNVAPDCDDAGSYDTVTYCTVCGDEISRVTTTVDALGHKAGEAVIENNVAPDCDTAGKYDTVVYCTVCGDEISRVTTTVDALGHKAMDAVKENDIAPKCEEDGSYDTVVYCSVCDKELSRVTTTVPALGHTAMDAVKENDIAPKCEEDGSYDTVVYCSVCDKELSRETTIVPATGHTPAEPVKENVDPATCTHAGSYDSVVYCATCGEELSRENVTEEILEHTPSAAVRENEKFGSCLEGGSYDSVIYCSGCGYEISRQPITVTEGTHTPGKAVIENKKNATCTTPSSYDLVVYCEVCPDEISRETIIGSTIAHKKGRAVKENEVKATCTTPGTYDQVVYCTVCGEEVSRVTVSVGAKGHTIVADKEVKPTCTTDGKTLGSHCTACGVVIVMQETVPAHGHYETDDYGYDATCTRPGLSYGSHCKKCGVVIIAQEEIPAPGHTDLNGDGICDIDGRDVTDMDPNYGIVVNPDADGDGYIDVNECEDCGREHTNFFSTIICFFIRIMRLFGYKIT